MNKKLSAIAISSVNYGESDKILTLLSAAGGKLSCIAKGARKQSAKLRFASELFCFGEYELTTGKGDMYILSGCELVDMFYELRLDIKKLYLASFLAESVKELCQESENTEKEFLFLIRALRDIKFAGDVSFYAVKAAVELITLSGYEIVYETCAKCGGEIGEEVGFSITEGGFLCGKCLEREIPYRIYKIIRFVSENDAEKVLNTEVKREFIVETLRLLSRYMEEKLLLSTENLKQLIKLI